ncbi:MAG: hypothetical protein NVSMB26_07160 [Beijerinckiaceae bacterium]
MFAPHDLTSLEDLAHVVQVALTPRDGAAGSALLIMFAAGLMCTVGALAAFLVEMLMASRGLRLKSLER